MSDHDATWPLRQAPRWLWDQPTLVCPQCGCACVHIDLVHVGTRTRENAAPFLVTVAADGTVTEQPAYEPRSERRQWVELVLECEDGCTTSVALAQHKGSTFVSSRKLATTEGVR